MTLIKIEDLGEGRDFHQTWDYQEKLVQQRRENLISDTLLLLEHQPIYTIGRTRDQTSLKSSTSLPYPIVELNRGGQATYHGPGQLVGYAIIDLSQYRKDLHWHLRNLEEALIRSLHDLDIQAVRRDGLTGVWVDDRKLASLGVGVRSWVTLHGFALNVTRESLAPFELITPCGIDRVAMTCIENETDQSVAMPQIKNLIGQHLDHLLTEESRSAS